MATTVIKGPEGSGRMTLAHTLRNTAIQKGRGCLLLGKDADGNPAALVEKLIREEKCPEDIANYEKPVIEDGTAVLKRGFDAVPWKPDPLIIVVGDGGKAKLNEIEERYPGFKEFMGPATGVITTLEEV